MKLKQKLRMKMKRRHRIKIFYSQYQILNLGNFKIWYSKNGIFLNTQWVPSLHRKLSNKFSRSAIIQNSKKLTEHICKKFDAGTTIGVHVMDYYGFGEGHEFSCNMLAEN